MGLIYAAGWRWAPATAHCGWMEPLKPAQRTMPKTSFSPLTLAEARVFRHISRFLLSLVPQSSIENDKNPLDDYIDSTPQGGCGYGR